MKRRGQASVSMAFEDESVFVDTSLEVLAVMNRNRCAPIKAAWRSWTRKAIASKGNE